MVHWKACLRTQPFINPSIIALFCDRWVDDFVWMWAAEHDAVVQTIGLALPEFNRHRTYQITTPKVK